MDAPELVKTSVDIVKVIEEYGTALRKRGANYVGICPFHSEKTPSFNVNSTHQFFKCFGCGEGGDVFTFVQKIENISFYEALKLIAERNGITLPKRTDMNDPDAKLRGAIFDMHEIATQFYRQALQSAAGREAIEYVYRRGVSSDAVQQFGLGYSDRSGQALVRRLQQAGFSPEQGEAAGLLGRSDHGYYDRFRGRLMFPIHNESGKVIGFGARALGDEQPKYLNSPETKLYRKSEVLYNLHRAKEAIRQNKQVILVEGYMDVIGVFAAGVQEVVATCGTALTPPQVKILRRFTERVVVNYDPDRAGSEAAERSLPLLLAEHMQIRVLTLAEGKDPDEFIQEHGAEGYREQLARAANYFGWLADRARHKFDLRTAEGKIAAFEHLLPVLLRVHDRVQRAAMADEVAGHLGLDPQVVREHFRKQAATRREGAPPAPVKPTLEGVRKVEAILLHTLLHSDDVRGAVIEVIKDFPAIRELRTAGILQAIFTHHQKGSFSVAGLEEMLNDADKELLGALLFQEGREEQPVGVEQVTWCVRQLEDLNTEVKTRELKQRIAEAQRAGDLASALQLAEELSALQTADRIQSRIRRVRSPS